MANKNKNTAPSPFHKGNKGEGDKKKNAWGRFWDWGEGGGQERWGEDEWGVKGTTKDMDKSFADFQGLKEGASENLWAGAESKMDLSNTMEDLTVNQQEAQFQAQQLQSMQANVLSAMREGGNFNADNIQALVNASAEQSQKISATIGAQESANQLAAAQQAAQNQVLMGQSEMDAQKIRLQGAADARELQIGMQQAELSYLAGLKEAAEANKDADTAGKSDRRLKKNINKIGQSASGLNIYSFEYKNSTDGKGLFQGVMSDEIPQEAVTRLDGYDTVNYSMLDVEFKQI